MRLRGPHPPASGPETDEGTPSVTLHRGLSGGRRRWSWVQNLKSREVGVRLRDRKRKVGEGPKGWCPRPSHTLRVTRQWASV